ncbi:RagB/SusD family nutrient uptake outer membrane protein [Pelobium sp.]|nr:RagB/SusD family nutrient uptake outer membrane protein [Pelobium sp.]MDA9555461.1 RagB/SusD family nutrient uptake outer membrane protein [Pelobium sp.]
MKIKYILIYSFLIAGLFSSCKKSLDEKVYGSYSELNSVATINSAALGLYQSLQLNQLSALYPMAEVGSRYSSYGSSGDNFGNRDFYRYIYTNRNTEFNDVWGYYYGLINRSNEVIEATQKVIKDTTVANPIIAEAKCLRAWNYFVLTQFFGDIPLHIKSTATSNQNDNNLPRTPVADIYAQIVDDLKYATVIFPDGKTRLPLTRDAANLGRVTAATALAMLGKVYLTMAGKPLNDPNGYQNAINTLRILVTNRVKYNTDLLPKGSYSRIFATNNEMNKEILFANRAFANSTNLIYGSRFPSMLSPVGSDLNSGVTGLASNISNTYGLRSDIVNLFQGNSTSSSAQLYGDARLRDGIGFIYQDMRPAGINATTGLRDSIIYNLSTKRYNVYRGGVIITTPPAASNITPTAGYGLAFTKYKADAPWFQNNIRGFNNDWIMLRFADVLLCYSEALNETGQSAVAIPFLNEVRLRANTSPISLTTGQSDLRKIIREERTRELVGEFTTVFDMRRWGTVQQEIEAIQLDQFLPSYVTPLPVYDPKYNLYPIPYAQIAINPNLKVKIPDWN